jgi:hypothetical protein
MTMTALRTRHTYHERTLELLVPCKLTGEYQHWANSTDLCAVEVETTDGQKVWVDPSSLCEDDGELIENLDRDVARKAGLLPEDQQWTGWPRPQEG